MGSHCHSVMLMRSSFAVSFCEVICRPLNESEMRTCSSLIRSVILAVASSCARKRLMTLARSGSRIFPSASRTTTSSSKILEAEQYLLGLKFEWLYIIIQHTQMLEIFRCALARSSVKSCSPMMHLRHDVLRLIKTRSCTSQTATFKLITGMDSNMYFAVFICFFIYILFG